MLQHARTGVAPLLDECDVPVVFEDGKLLARLNVSLFAQLFG